MLERPRVLLLDPQNYCDEAKTIIRSVAELHERQMDSKELHYSIPEYDALVVRFSHVIDEGLIHRAVRLKAIVTNATGTDHIDVAAALQNNIKVISLKGETDFLNQISSTAELAWGLLLCIARRIPPAVSHVKSGGWDRESFIGQDLASKRLGILGLGRLGRKIARYGLAFDMEVAAYDTNPSCRFSGVAMLPNPRNLFEWADVVSIHIPLTVYNRRFVDASLLGALRPGAWLINTSRGAVLDEVSLVTYLSNGRVGAAAVDVLEGELHSGSLKDNVLIGYAQEHDNLIITPHIGGASWDSWRKTEVFTAHKLAQFLQRKSDVPAHAS